MFITKWIWYLSMIQWNSSFINYLDWNNHMLPSMLIPEFETNALNQNKHKCTDCYFREFDMIFWWTPSCFYTNDLLRFVDSSIDNSVDKVLHLYECDVQVKHFTFEMCQCDFVELNKWIYESGPLHSVWQMDGWMTSC